jgi:C-terminal processing protease CtpA/Prc
LTAAFTVVQLREGSPAKLAGVEIGDIILSVNGKDSHLYSLQEIIQMFYGDTGKRINLLVDRDGIRLKLQFRLENLL